jgi:conjugal transfer pilus assembly protein TrbC
MHKLFVSLALGVAALTAQAQSPTPPVQNEINRALAAGDAAAKAASASNAAAVNSIGVLPGTGGTISKATKDDFSGVSALAKSGGVRQAAPKPKNTSDLMIFVSMSMPEAMLQNYAAQAKRFGGVLMMRGFIDDKLSTTREVLQRLNAAGASWEISPEPFKHFKITKVPAIVMATADSTSVLEDGCAKPDTYTAIFGDLPVSAALDKMALLGQKEIAAMAKKRLVDDKAGVLVN